jgi:hypothetical protein
MARKQPAMAVTALTDEFETETGASYRLKLVNFNRSQKQKSHVVGTISLLCHRITNHRAKSLILENAKLMQNELHVKNSSTYFFF